MKKLLLLSIGLSSTVIASPNLTKSTCDILQKEIKQTLETQSVGQQSTHKEMLQALSPELDIHFVDNLATKISVLKYDDPVMSRSQLDEYKKLKKLDKEKFTEKNKKRFKELKKLHKEHQTRMFLEQSAKDELKHYIKNQIKNRVKNSSIFQVTKSNFDFYPDNYSLESSNAKFEFNDDAFNRFPWDSSLDGDDGYLTFNNEKGQKGNYIFSGDDSFFYINETSHSIHHKLGSSSGSGGSHLDESLNELINVEVKTWADFGLEGLLNRELFFEPYSTKPNVITQIRSDVRTKIDHKTGKRTVEFRTIIANDKDVWAYFPKDYTSSDNMAQLLLPRSCKRFDNVGWFGDLKESVFDETRKTVAHIKRITSGLTKRIGQGSRIQ